MKALTLTQPWAGLVASGIKLVENRPRPMGAQRMIGERIAIHASRQIDRDVFARIEEIGASAYCGKYLGDNDATCPQLTCIRGRRHGGTCDNTRGWRELADITSAVIAVATLAEIKIAPLGEPLPPDQSRWFFGPVGIVLRDVIALPEPIAGVRGALGFWTLPADIERQVNEQIARGA